jgi:hypothetical protein
MGSNGVMGEGSRAGFDRAGRHQVHEAVDRKGEAAPGTTSTNHLSLATSATPSLTDVERAPRDVHGYHTGDRGGKQSHMPNGVGAGRSGRC